MIYKLSKINPHSNIYGLARTLLALGSISTLIFNSLAEFFPLKGDLGLVKKFQNPLSYTWIDNISIFSLLKDNLLLAKILCILMLIFVIIGWKPRLTGIFHWWISMSIFISIDVPDGGDQLTAVLTLLLLPICLTDSRKWHWGLKKNKNSKYLNLILYSFYIIIKLQVCLLYLQASVDKFSVSEWRNGSVLYYWFTHNIFGLNDFFKPLILPFLQNSFFLTTLTWSVLALELLLFSAFFASQKFKKRIFYFAIIFHFMIFIIHGLFSFFIAMSGALLLYLFPPNYNLTFLTKKIKNKDL